MGLVYHCCQAWGEGLKYFYGDLTGGNLKIFQILMILWGFALLALPSTVQAATLQSVYVPCRDVGTESQDLTRLTESQRLRRAFKPCTEVRPRVLQDLHQNVDTLIRRNYHYVVPNPPAPPPGSPPTFIKELPPWRPVMSVRSSTATEDIPACSLTEFQFGSIHVVSEGHGGHLSGGSRETNHKGESCGKFCNLVLKRKKVLGSDGNPLTLDATITGRSDGVSFFAKIPKPLDPTQPPPVTPETVEYKIAFEDLFELGLDPKFPSCARMDSFGRGFYVHLLAYEHAQVCQEVVKNQSIKITSIDATTSSATTPAATDLLKQMTQYGQAVDAFGNRRDNVLGMIERCLKGEKIPYISPCLLAVAREYIESLFAYLSLAEVSARAAREYYQDFNPTSPFLQEIQGKVMRQCQPRCRARVACGASERFCDVTLFELSREIESCAQSCYEERFVQELKKAIEEKYPISECQISMARTNVPVQAGFSWVHFVVFLLFVLFQKRPSRRFLSGLAITISFLFLAGCDEEEPIVFFNSCRDEMTTQLGEVRRSCGYEDALSGSVKEPMSEAVITALQISEAKNAQVYYWLAVVMDYTDEFELRRVSFSQALGGLEEPSQKVNPQGATQSPATAQSFDLQDALNFKPPAREKKVPSTPKLPQKRPLLPRDSRK